MVKTICVIMCVSSIPGDTLSVLWELMHFMFSLMLPWEWHLMMQPSICYLFQLELQRNEVIALMNLLNRLSESVKYVHDMSPAAESIAGQASPGTSFWKRIVTSLVKTKGKKAL